MFSEDMHLNILTARQQELLPLVRRFKRSFYLVGGTAIALHLGHRRSIDFDLFTPGKLSKSRIRTVLNAYPFPKKPLHEDVDQLHVLCNQVKLTFFSYPYPVEHKDEAGDFMTMPDLLSLAAMKAFALGRRAKWKDYVDLYFIMQNGLSIGEISAAANTLFSDQYSEKLFREQLAFHDDIDYTETVDYMTEPVADETVRSGLIKMATHIL